MLPTTCTVDCFAYTRNTNFTVKLPFSENFSTLIAHHVTLDINKKYYFHHQNIGRTNYKFDKYMYETNKS